MLYNSHIIVEFLLIFYLFIILSSLLSLLCTVFILILHVNVKTSSTH